MATLNNLIDEVQMRLSGYTNRQDRVTYVTEAVAYDALTVPVNSVENIGRGIVEIDNEMLWVDSVDRSSSTLLIAPFGRGYLGTTAANHDANAKLTVAPTYPRHGIKNAINDAIVGIFPDVYGSGKYTFSYQPAVMTYALPNDVEDVTAITFETIGASKAWAPIRSWEVDKNANVEAFDTSKTVTLFGAVQPGSTVQVVYTKQPSTLEYFTDDFQIVSGLDANTKELIVLGATYRMLSSIDPSVLNYVTPESNTQLGKLPSGSGTNVARYVYALYQQELQNQVRRLKKQFPARVHRTRF
jgi:hypothetical protein